MSRIADTHVLLWSAFKSASLSSRARAILSDTSVPIYFSLASVWEIAIKLAVKKIDLPESLPDFVRGLRARGFLILTIEVADAVRVAELPLHHRDPFDRMLVAQAQQRRFGMISADPMLAPYGVDVLW